MQEHRWCQSGAAFPENLNGTDFVPALFSKMQGGRKIALLGARPGIADLRRCSANGDNIKCKRWIVRIIDCVARTFNEKNISVSRFHKSGCTRCWRRGRIHN